MNNGIIATVGDQQGSLYIKRPRWINIQSSYEEVGRLNPYLSYQQVGGYAYKLHVENPNDYANACALRISWAFNYGGYKIPSGTIFTDRNIYRVKGEDGLPYILRVEDIIFFIKNKWGESEIDNIDFLDISRKLSGNGVEDESHYHNDDYHESRILNVQFWELK